jgi:hypothetical protein
MICLLVVKIIAYSIFLIRRMLLEKGNQCVYPKGTNVILVGQILNGTLL